MKFKISKEFLVFLITIQVQFQLTLETNPLRNFRNNLVLLRPRLKATFNGIMSRPPRPDPGPGPGPGSGSGPDSSWIPMTMGPNGELRPEVNMGPRPEREPGNGMMGGKFPRMVHFNEINGNHLDVPPIEKEQQPQLVVNENDVPVLRGVRQPGIPGIALDGPLGQEPMGLVDPHVGTPHQSCYRRCSTDPTSRMTCSFNFTVANYYTLSPHCYQCPNVTADCGRLACIAADGRARPIAVVNKMMPGPPIRVCEGDTIVVDVHNKLVGQETTIHWHGILQQGTPWMDGVPHLTQCPIPEGTTFRYQFETPKSGTYFWHSHSGVQRADGVVGSLVVRKAPEVDVQSQLYDYDLAEHEIMVWDWLSGLALSGHLMGHVTDERELPQSILVNGKGFPPDFFEDFSPFDTLQSRGKVFAPINEVRIQQNLAYRFRLISNGITMCPIEFSIDEHSLLVIASDGADVVPVFVQSLVIYAGERFDFVVRGDQPPGSYWMKFRGLIDCNMTNTFQLGVLNYEGIPQGTFPDHTISTWEDSAPSNPGVQLNSLNIAPGIPEQVVTITELSSVVDDDPEIIRQELADHQFYLAYDFNRVANINFGKPRDDPHQLSLERMNSVTNLIPQLNFISHAMPSSPPLIQPETISQLNRCNAESKAAEGQNCMRTHCKCTHWINVKLNSIVELILVDMGVQFDAAHPFHLHGHAFRVIGMQRLGNTTVPQIIQEWDREGILPRRRSMAPIKDTVYVPDGGYTILRFRANNPGYWFFHCHIEFHSERGMALIIQVGDENEIPRAPPHFPTCGNYVPPVDSSAGIPSFLGYREPDQFLHRVM